MRTLLCLTLLICAVFAQQQYDGSHPSGSATSCPEVRIDWRLNMLGGAGDPTAWGGVCDEQLSADFHARDKIPQYYGEYPCFVDSRGPLPTIFPTVVAPGSCGAALFHQRRSVAVMGQIISQGYNFCYHDVPNWSPPNDANNTEPYFRVPIDPCSIAMPPKATAPRVPASPDDITVSYPGTCSSSGMLGRKPYQGLDAGSFAAFVFNYGFGISLTTNLQDQACGPNAPGRALPYTAREVSKFNPGDLLYISSVSEKGTKYISHVALWTGIRAELEGECPFIVTRLLQNVPSCHRAAVRRSITQLTEAGQPIYIIADSFDSGPNYRLFAGWWSQAFSHARRLISPDPSAARYHTFTEYSKEKGCRNVLKSRKNKSTKDNGRVRKIRKISFEDDENDYLF